MKQIFLLEDGILTYLAFAATADGKKVYVADSVYNIVSAYIRQVNNRNLIFLMIAFLYIIQIWVVVQK